jgi:flagellar hook-length control protein FliK
MSVVGAGAQPTMPTATPTHAAPIGLVDVAGPVDRTEPGDGTGHASAGTSGPGDVSSPVTAVDGSSAASVSVAGSPVAAPGARTRGETTTAVLRQVFPEVTRVATQAGPGTHRLSLTLHPETLGEVKVTLVVRAGTVHVSLAAGTGVAHDALLQGAPELRRLLEVTGGDARVVVRDSTSSGSPASSAAISTATTADQHDADGRGQQAPYAPSAGDGRASRDGQDRRDGRTTSAAVGEPASLPGARPRNPRGAGQTRTAVHPGRLDRLM